MSDLAQYIDLLLRTPKEPGWKARIPKPSQQIRLKPLTHPKLDVHDRSDVDQVEFWRKIYENGHFYPDQPIREENVLEVEKYLPAITHTYPHGALPPTLQRIATREIRRQQLMSRNQHRTASPTETEDDKEGQTKSSNSKMVSFDDHNVQNSHCFGESTVSKESSEMLIDSRTPSPKKPLTRCTTSRVTSAPTGIQMPPPSPTLRTTSASPTKHIFSSGFSQRQPSMGSHMQSDISGSTGVGEQSYSSSWSSQQGVLSSPKQKQLLRRPLAVPQIVARPVSQCTDPLDRWVRHSFTTVCIDDPLDEHGFYRRHYPLLLQKVPRRHGNSTGSQNNDSSMEMYRPLKTPNISLEFLGPELKWKISTKNVDLWDAFNFQ